MIREYDCECYDCPMAYPPILDECIEDIWCDKVGGKLYAFGTCGEEYLECQPIQEKSKRSHGRVYRRRMARKKEKRRRWLIRECSSTGGYIAWGWIDGNYVEIEHMFSSQRIQMLNTIGKDRQTRKFVDIKKTFHMGAIIKGCFLICGRFTFKEDKWKRRSVLQENDREIYMAMILMTAI